MKHPGPKISVIIRTAQLSKSLAISLESLKRQSVSRDIELILLSSMSDNTTLQRQADNGFCRVEIVPIDDRLHEGEHKTEGISKATAPLIMFLEDHSYADSKCLENIIAIHNSRDCAAVGPLVLNANPGSATGWGCYLVFYGQWGYRQPDGRNTHLPANQSCYTRAILEANEQGLADKLRVESVFHWELIAHGHRLILADSALAYHLNTSRLPILLLEYFLNSRLFAASRFNRGAWLKRMIFTIGAPLIPFIRFGRIIKMYTPAQIPAKSILMSFPALWLCLSAGALGEAVGYSIGSGGAADLLHRLLMNPDKLVKAEDLDEVPRTLSRDSYIGR